MTHDTKASAPMESASKPPLSHKDWMVLLWSPRIAIHIPEIFHRDNQRLGTDNILDIIGPWVPWPDSLLRDFTDYLQNDSDSELTLIGDCDDEATKLNSVR